MTLFDRTLALAMLLGATARASDPGWPRPPRNDAPDRVSLSLADRAGLVEAPFVTEAFPEVSGFGMVLTGAAGVQLAPVGWVRARLPVAVVRLDFPAGAQVPESALGNLELGLEYELDLELGVADDPELRRSTRLGLWGFWIAPTAEHDSKTALIKNRALAIASALNGGKDAAVLTPGVTGGRLGASLAHSLPPFELRGNLDLPVLVRISDASLPEDSETHPVGVLPAIDLAAAWRVAPSFAVSLGVALITEPWRVQEPTLGRDRSSRLQPLLEPALHWQLGSHVNLGLDASLPVGGTLGGDAWSIGVQGRVQL